MSTSEDPKTSKSEKRNNMLTGLGVGAALGVVFWSALDGLFPFPLDLFAGIGMGIIIGYTLGRRPLMSMRYPANIIRRLLLSGALFVFASVVYFYLLDLDFEYPTQYMITLIAIIPAILLVMAIGSAIRSLDELQRHIQTEGIAIAFGGTAIVVFVIFIFETAGMPNPTWGLMLLIMTFMWLIGKLWTVWRYR